MHARIYQLAKEPVEKEDYITPDMFECPNEKMDYVCETETYEEDVKDLVEYVLPMNCFSLMGNDTIFYNRFGLHGFVEKWVKKIRLNANSIDEVKLSYFLERLEQLIKYPTEDPSLIYMEGYGVMTPGKWIATIMNDLRGGDKFYIGNILDFHY